MSNKPQNPYSKRRNTEQNARASRYRNTADAHVSTGDDTEPTVLTGISDFVTRLSTEIRKWFRGLGAREVRIAITPSLTTQLALDVIEAKKRTGFDDQNSAHEDLLKILWRILKPDIPYQRISPIWPDIGFQGKNPATDFRGQGVLGLINLVHFVENYETEAQDMLHRPHGGFPLALAAINISAKLTTLLMQHPGEMGNRLFAGTNSSEEQERRFDELFTLVFMNFESFYSDAIAEYLKDGNPAFTIMQFNPIMEKYLKVLTSTILANEFESKYASVALQRQNQRS
eukprot:m.32016 g.32016  ORF g.32016 m.32016 type:complete len:286 (+) comp16566_c0_seq1:218-1075(+)